jgi:hypothetical protein
MFAGTVFASLYGEAARPDVQWLTSIATKAAELERPAVLIGDLNWGEAYRCVELLGFRLPEHQPPTVIGGGASAPTRCLVLNGEVGDIDVCPLPGMPHHAAVIYTLSLEVEAWK